MVLVSVLFIFLIILGIIENYLHIRNLSKIKYRILVNGTRGKTTVSKIIVSALNRKGIKTIGRTTGSEATILMDDGSVRPFVRKRSARITEMISFVRFCRKNNTECLVAECMALSEENQSIFANKLIKETHLVIVNSYIDHIAEVGKDRDSTLYTLSKSIYPGCKVYSTDPEYSDAKCEFNLVEDNYSEYKELPVNIQSLNCAYSILKDFGLTKEEVLAAAALITPDIGLHDKFILQNGSILYPSFSINDFDTMNSKIRELGTEKKISIIFNSRSDREYRIKTFEKALYNNVERVEKVYIVGDYPKKVQRYLNHWCKVETSVISCDSLIEYIKNNKSKEVFLGLGNIKGPGEAIVREMLKEDM